MKYIFQKYLFSKNPSIRLKGKGLGEGLFNPLYYFSCLSVSLFLFFTAFLACSATADLKFFKENFSGLILTSRLLFSD